MFSSMPGSFGGLPHPLSFDSKGHVIVLEYDHAAKKGLVQKCVRAEMRVPPCQRLSTIFTPADAPTFGVPYTGCVSYERANRRAHWWR